MATENEATTPLLNPVAVTEAIEELKNNADEYKDIIAVLRDPVKRKDVSILIKEGSEAVGEAIKDYKVAFPAVKNVAGALRAGISTSEFKTTSVVGRALMIIGILAPVIEAVMFQLQDVAIFDGNSVWVTLASVTLKALLAGNYASGRARIKTAALETRLVDFEQK